jgi:four helix bundle protein
MFRFETLEIWHESISYSKDIYKIAETLPSNEEFGLKSQIKRAALSISSNIAEGSGSSSKKDFCHFLDIAIKSTIETVSQLKFGKEMGYFENKNIDTLYNKAEVLIKRIQAFKKSLT